MQRALILCFALVQIVFQANAQKTRLVEKVEQKGDEVVIPFEKYVLPNGLTVVIHEDHSDPLVHVDVTYHVGSAREEIGKSGFAHFFEHMMFQGSDNVADEQHFKIVTESGGTLNGTTNRDRTNYFETVPSNQLEKMLWLEADRMGFLLDAVTQRKFEIQRETVKNERGQNYDNRPYGLVGETIAKNLYPYGHPYSWLTIGYIEDLNRVDVNDLKNFFLRWYGPNNATVTIGGDVDTREVLRLVEKYFGSIPRGPEVADVTLPAPVLNADRYVTLADNYARLPMLVVTWPSVPSYHKDEAALDCLAEIIGQGKNSILYQNIVKDQKALNASAFNSSSELAGEFRISLTPAPGVPLAESKKLIDEAIQAFEMRGVTDDDIAKFTGSIEAGMISSLQSVSGKVRQLAYYETFTGSPNQITNDLKRYTSVTREDVMRVYNQYLKGKHSVVLSVTTKGSEDNVAAAPNYTIDQSAYKAPDYGYAGLKYEKPKDNFDRSKMPGNGENPVVKVPEFWKKDLQNGIKAIGTESDELPLVTISLTLPGGDMLYANDTSRAGVARIFALMMNEDTKNHTAEEIQFELQKIGSSLRVNSGFDGITVTAQSLAKNLDKTLSLMEERLLRPRFTDEAFDRIKKQTLESFKMRKSTPATVANDVWGKLIYGPGHILGISSVGTEFSVKNLSLADVQNYYDKAITSQGGRLVVVGDVKEADVLAKLKFLDNLPNKKIDLPKLASAPEPGKARIYLVDIPRAAQTQFRVGYATGLKYDATGEYYKASLMNYALGGAFNSRINLNLREDKGWTYGARVSLSGDQYTGEYYFSSGIRADATDSALVEVVNEFTAYAKEGIQDDEIEFMKSSLGQRDALLYETPFQKARFIDRMLEYNLPEDYVDQQNAILASIDKNEINRLARKLIDPEKMYILLVGDKEKIQPGLKRLGYEIVELDVNGDPKMKASLESMK